MQLDRTQAPVAPPLTFRALPPYHTFHLSNGLEVLMLPFGKVPVVEIDAVFTAGTGFQAYPGLANYTARNMFEGTRTYSSLELAQKQDELGAWTGHQANIDTFFFYLATLNHHLEETLPLLREILFEPVFHEEEFVKMKTRGLEQLQVSLKKTAYHASRQFQHLMYGPDHPNGMHVGPEELKAIQLEDLRTYHQHFFYPANMRLTVVGNYREQEVLKQLEATFGSLPMQPSDVDQVSRGSAPPQPFQPGRHHFPLEGLQSTLILAHPGTVLSHPDYYGAKILNTVLGGYFGSRLMHNIREEKGYTYGIHSSWASMKYQGHFLVQSDVGNEYVEATISEVKKEMQRLREEPIPEEELTLVKNYLRGRSISERETPFQISNLLKHALNHDLSFEEIDRYYQVLDEITPEQLQAIAQQYLHPDKLLEIVSGGSDGQGH